MEKDERSASAVEGAKNMPKIPDCWELRKNGCAQGTDQVLEEGVWVSLVDIALETLHVLAGLPIENFNVPVITIVRDE